MAGKRSALIVATDDYAHAGLSRLRSPAADAAALSRVLGDPAIGGFEVATVRNEPAHVISARIEDFFTDGRPDDVLLLHFSCHGLKSAAGELYFAAATTRPDRLASTAVAADLVQRCMRASRSRHIVLLLDCCYGGAFGPGVRVRAAGDVPVLETFRGGGRGRAVITASSAMEYAFEGDVLADDHEPAPSVFTAALVEGLETGEADRDGDGWVSLDELYDYVFDRVRERTPHQTPSRDVAMQGDLYLARSPRRRVRPQPVPREVRAALADASVFSRTGAVAELRTRLSDADVAVAAGALDALREVVAGDIAHVADAARAALDDARTTVAAAAVQLGDAPVTVGLPGPPLARLVTAECSEPWLRARVDDAGVTVSAAPGTGTGTNTGTVTLTGPVSAATITVTRRATTTVTTPAAGPIAPARALPATPWVPLAAGAAALVLGVLILGLDATTDKVYAAEGHLGLWAAYWLWQALIRRGRHRVVPLLIAGWTLLTLIWMLAVTWDYMEEYDLDGTPLRVFWLLTGLLVAATAPGRPEDPRPAVLLGAICVTFGALVLVIAGRDSDTAFEVAYAFFVLITGILGLTAGWPAAARAR